MLAYNNISALRQQLKTTHRVHGIIEGKDWVPNGLFPFQLSENDRHDPSIVIPDYSKILCVLVLSSQVSFDWNAVVMFAHPRDQKWKRL